MRIPLFLVLACSLPAADIVWDSPSKDSSGSMPLGNGDAALNLWVEPSGDILLYLSKSDAWSEEVRLVKVGRVRLRLSPNPLPGNFRQELDTETGQILLHLGKSKIGVWVDANQPVIHVEGESPKPFTIVPSAEIWRTRERTLAGEEAHSAYGLDEGPEPVVVRPDVLLPNQPGRITWYHHNRNSPFPEVLRHQGLGALTGKLADPILNRTFGASIVFSETPGRSQHLAIHLHTSQKPSPASWLEELNRRISSSQPLPQARKAHLAWWREFWQRSWIKVTGPPETQAVTRGYRLQRFLNACAGRGAYPIKFNGSLFNVDAPRAGGVYDADYRRWGGPYWFQNTRLPYWSMLAAGDYDLMDPLFAMYRDALPLARQRTRIWYNHPGSFFPETMYFFGTHVPKNYGWKRAGLGMADIDNPYIRHHFNSGIELIALMLERHAHRPDPAFLKQTLLPLADEILMFYDEHYLLGDGGKLRIEPSQALETYQDAVNTMPDVAGLHYVLARLFYQGGDAIPKTMRGRWETMHSELPPIPVSGDAAPVLRAAEEIRGPARNTENPELYAVFPFRLYTVGSADLELGRATYRARRIKDDRGGWRQDPIQAAYLGLAEEAARYVARNFATHHTGSRFPAFWGPNFDWIPDQCHGAVQMIALQAMLLQSNYGRIEAFPAWPRNWNVDFRLHAGTDTQVEGVYRNGKLEKFKVTPSHRVEQVRQHQPQ